MIIRGKTWKFGDDISTDHIAPGRYYHLRSNLKEFAKHVLEDGDPEFPKKVQEGKETYIVVGGKNFGQGSSREHAPRIIKIAGVPAVLAKGFARIFYRNSINVGLPVLVVDTDKIDHGDELEIDLAKGEVKNLTKGITLKTDAIPEIMLKILKEGGIVEYIKAHGDIVF